MTGAAEIVRSYMVQTTRDLVRSYNEKGLKASGKYEKGLTYTVEDSGTKIKAWIESEGHVWFMEKGRKRNKKRTEKELIGFALWALDEDKPGGGFIKKWMRDKGIVFDKPFAVAYKIGAEGINVPNMYNPGKVVEDVVTNEWYDGLVEQLREHWIFVVQTQVERLFRK